MSEMRYVRLFVCKQVNDIPMETIHKEHYEAPSMTVFEVRQKGVICASGDPADATRQNYEYEIW